MNECRFPIRINGKESHRWEDEPDIFHFRWYLWLFGIPMGITEFVLYKHGDYSTMRTVVFVTVILWLLISGISFIICCRKDKKDKDGSLYKAKKERSWKINP